MFQQMKMKYSTKFLHHKLFFFCVEGNENNFQLVISLKCNCCPLTQGEGVPKHYHILTKAAYSSDFDTKVQLKAGRIFPLCSF